MTDHPSPEQLTSNFRKLNAFQFLLSLQFIGGVLVVFFTNWGKISFAQVMFLQSCYVVFSLLLEMPTGAMADILGRKLSLTAATLVRTAAVLVYASYPNFYVFLAAEFLWAISESLVSGADQAFVYDSLKALDKSKDAPAVFARLKNYSLSGFLVSAPIGSLIAGWLGLRYAMMLIALPSLVAFLVALTLHEPPREKVQESLHKRPHYLRAMKTALHELARDKTLRPLVLDRITVSSMAFFLIWVYQPLLEKLHVPLFWFGIVHAALTGVQIIVIARLAMLERFFGSPKAFLTGSSVICGLSFILLGLQQNWYGAVIFMLLIGGFGLTRVVPYQGHINRHVGSSHRATVLSAISMAEKLCRAVTYPLIGWLLERSPSILLAGVGTTILAISFAAGRHIKNEDLQPAAAS
ncbi:MAG: MFS transporter [Alphaproteobacteria bacterium]|nr:MFS transporter [Alphaproteobacteria bacterium]